MLYHLIDEFLLFIECHLRSAPLSLTTTNELYFYIFSLFSAQTLCVSVYVSVVQLFHSNSTFIFNSDIIESVFMCFD